MSIKTIILFCFCSFFFLLYVFFIIPSQFNNNMLAYGDFASFPRNYQEAFNKFLFIWHPMSHGDIIPQPIYWIFIGALIFFFKNNIIAQYVYWVLPVLLSVFSVYYFLNRFAKSKIIKMFTSVLYIMNPYFFGTYVGGSIGMLYSYAFIPLLILFLINILEGQKIIKNIVLFALFFAFALSYSWHVIIVICLFLFFWFILCVLAKNTASLRRISKAMLAFIISIFLLFPWLISQLRYLFNFAFFKTIFTPINTVKDLTVNAIKYCYGNLMMPRILALHDMDTVLILGLVFPILTYLIFIMLKRIDYFRKKYIFIFSFYSISLIGFMWLTHLGFTFKLFEIFPFITIFKNPAKLSMMLAFTYLPLIGMTLEIIIEKIEGLSKYAKFKIFHKYNSFFVLLVLFSILYFYNKQFLTPDLGLSKYRTDLTISKRIQRIGAELNKIRTDGGFFRTIWLPWEYESVELKLREIDPYTFSTPLGIAQYEINLPSRPLSIIFNAIKNRNLEIISSLLAIMNVKYVLINLEVLGKEIQYYTWYDNPYIKGDGYDFLKLFSQCHGLHYLYNKDGFAFFENIYFLPHIYPTTTPTLINADIKALIPITETKYLEGKPVLVFSEQIHESTGLSEYQGIRVSENPNIRFVLKDSSWRDLAIELAHSSLLMADRVEVEKAGVYEVYVPKSWIGSISSIGSIGSDGLEIRVEGKELAYSSWFMADGRNRKYVKIGEVEVGKGKHRIEIVRVSEYPDIREKAEIKLVLVEKEEREKVEKEIWERMNQEGTEICYIFSEKEAEFWVK